MFRFLDDLATRGFYKTVNLPQKNAQGQYVADQNGQPIKRQFQMAAAPVISRFLGALEDDPIAVTGSLYAAQPNGAAKVFDLDTNWGYLTLNEVAEIYVAAAKNDACRAIGVQTLRSGVESAQLCTLSGTPESIAVAEKYGLHLQSRSQTLPDGSIVEVGTMEVAITDAAIAAAMHRKVFKGSKGRLQGLTGPVGVGTKANDHLGVIVGAIAATGNLPTKVTVPTATQVAQAHASAAFEDQLASTVEAPAQRPATRR